MSEKRTQMARNTRNGNSNGNSNGYENGYNNGYGQRNVDVDFLHRLERGFNQQESEFQRTRDDVNALKIQQSAILRDIGNLDAGIRSLATKLDEKSKTNWPAIALATTMFFAVIPGLGFVMASYTATAIGPVKNSADLNSENLRHATDALHAVENLATSSQAADVTSRSDRQQLNERSRALETALSGEIADRRATGAAVKVSLAEIESQFHALSNVENLRAAQQERLNSMLWEKSHPGERYPNGTFFPTSMFGSIGVNNIGSP